MSTRRKLNKLIVLTVLFLALTACSKNTLEFKKENEFEYDEAFNTCSLVESINEQLLPGLLNDGNEIKYKNITIKCNADNTKLIPNEKLVIVFVMGNERFEKEILLKNDDLKEKPKEEKKPKPEGESKPKEEEKPKVEEEPKKETEVEELEPSEPEIDEPYVEPESPIDEVETDVPNVGVHRQFYSSEAVSNIDAQNACVAYASQYTNFIGCFPMIDSSTGLTIGYETK